MSREILKQKVIELIEKTLETSVDDIQRDLTEIGLDSMKAIHMIVELEIQYNIEFEDDELLLENFCTVNSIISKLESKLLNVKA